LFAAFLRVRDDHIEDSRNTRFVRHAKKFRHAIGNHSHGKIEQQDSTEPDR